MIQTERQIDVCGRVHTIKEMHDYNTSSNLNVVKINTASYTTGEDMIHLLQYVSMNRKIQYKKQYISLIYYTKGEGQRN